MFAFNELENCKELEKMKVRNYGWMIFKKLFKELYYYSEQTLDNFKPPKFSWIIQCKKIKQRCFCVKYIFSDLRMTELTIQYFY